MFKMLAQERLAETVVAPQLPQLPPDAYLKPASFHQLDRQTFDGLFSRVIASHSMLAAKELEGPLTTDERSIIENLLPFIDSCVPFADDRFRIPKNPIIKLARGVAANLLRLESDNLYDIEDLQQEARLRTIVTLRNFDLSKKAHSVIGTAPSNIAARYEYLLSKTLSGGFTSRSAPITSIPARQSISLSHAARRAADHRFEDGWSDEIEELQAHPNFCYKTRLKCVVRQEDEDKLGDLKFKEPAQDIEDMTARDDLDAVEASADINCILSIAELQGAKLSDSQVTVLEMYYEQGLTMRQIGLTFDPPIAQQAVSLRMKAALTKLRTIKAHLAELPR